MRIYLEAREKQVGEISATDFVRLDVTNKNEVERGVILTSLKDFMDGIDCVFTIHFCPHDKKQGACTTEVV